MIKTISPFFSGIVLLAVIAAIMQIPLDRIITTSYFSRFQVEYLILAIKMLLIFTCGLILVLKQDEKALSGISSKYKWSFKYLNLIPCYLFLLGILTFINKDLSSIDSSNVLLLLTGCLSVGFAEEFVFRGYLQPIFLKKYIAHKNGIFLGVLFPAMFFGASHLLNLTVNDNVPQVIGQSIYAVFIGFFFGVVLLKTNKLIPLAITHGLINFFFLFGSLPNLKTDSNSNLEPELKITLVEQIISSAMPLLIFIPLFLIGFVIVRKIQREEVQKKINL
ncbi:MAG: CPBP family intramembrane glutamic endopeptidase [Bacteroidota bacterium]